MAKKKEEPLQVKDKETLDKALGQIRVLNARIDAENASLNADIAQLKNERSKALTDEKAELERLEKEIEDYCTANKETLFEGDKKTLKLTNGTVSFKKSASKLVQLVGFTVDKTVSLLKNSIMGNAFLRKEEPTLNKDVIKDAYEKNKTISRAELNAYGLDVEDGEDKFGYKLIELKG